LRRRIIGKIGCEKIFFSKDQGKDSGGSMFARIPMLIVSGILLLGLTTCSHYPPYVKPGSSEKDLQEALTFCNAQQTSSDLNAQIRDKMSNPGMAGGGMTGGRMLEQQKALDECLRAQGWKPR
jgi:hypothetical protein